MARHFYLSPVSSSSCQQQQTRLRISLTLCDYRYDIGQKVRVTSHTTTEVGDKEKPPSDTRLRTTLASCLPSA